MTPNGPHTPSEVQHRQRLNENSNTMKSSAKMIHSGKPFCFFFPIGAIGKCFAIATIPSHGHKTCHIHTPDVYAASAAVSHNLAALTQVASKRTHSSRLSLTWRTKRKEESPDQNLSVNVLSMSSIVL